MTTALETYATTRTTHRRDLLGIVQVSVPVTDLARSAAWYRDLLDLQYVREFGDRHDVSGCALADFASHYMIALRRRDTTAEHADLRGEHPIIVEAVDEAAANRVRTRAAALGVASTSGEHADGAWIEFIDPDGIALRVVYNASGPQHFIGVLSNDDGLAFYETPRLQLPAPHQENGYSPAR